MVVKTFDCVESFRKEVIPFLSQYEAENNLPLGVVSRLSKDDQPEIMAVVYKNGEIVLTILQTHPRQAILSKPLNLTIDELEDIANQLHKYYPKIPGLIGESQLVKTMTSYLQNQRDFEPFTHMSQKVYVLKEVEQPANENGTLRPVMERDRPIAIKWLGAFFEEADEPVTPEEIDTKINNFIAKGTLYFWEVDGEPVSMAGASRPTVNNISVNAVYTPRDKRKRGYASNVVAALTQLLLDKGYQTTTLYTDLANPTSNKIYTAIGYKPIADSTVIYFKEQSHP